MLRFYQLVACLTQDLLLNPRLILVAHPSPAKSKLVRPSVANHDLKPLPTTRRHADLEMVLHRDDSAEQKYQLREKVCCYKLALFPIAKRPYIILASACSMRRKKIKKKKQQFAPSTKDLLFMHVWFCEVYFCELL